MRRPYLSTSVPGACVSLAVSMTGLKDVRLLGVLSGLSVSLCMACLVVVSGSESGPPLKWSGDYQTSAALSQVERSKLKKFILTAVMAGSFLLAGCVGGIVSPGPDRAEVKLLSTAGHEARGSVQFSVAGKKVRVVAEVAGLSPGPHGFHIHEKGDCSSSDGASAGGHFNPYGKPHGKPDQAERHGGDMPQLIADAKGVAKLVAYLDDLIVAEGTAENDIVGRSVIVHAGADDFKTQPAGNSGARVACGVIVKK